MALEKLEVAAAANMLCSNYRCATAASFSLTFSVSYIGTWQYWQLDYQNKLMAKHYMSTINIQI